MPFFVIDSHVHIYTVARVTSVGEDRIQCRVLVLKPERKATSESWLWVGGGINILNRMGGCGLDLFGTSYGHVAVVVNTIMSLKGSVKWGNFVYRRRNFWHLKDSAP
jgi:hypothetical protein